MWAEVSSSNLLWRTPSGRHKKEMFAFTRVHAAGKGKLAAVGDQVADSTNMGAEVSCSSE